jgi:hypothetical protein
MSIRHFCAWLESTHLATSIRVSTWLFPTIETIHVLAIVLVVGSIARFDLRLLNLAYRDRKVSEVYEEVVPWTWVCFSFAAIAGSFSNEDAAVAAQRRKHSNLSTLDLSHRRALGFRSTHTVGCKVRRRVVSGPLDFYRGFRPMDRLHYVVQRRSSEGPKKAPRRNDHAYDS